MTDETITGSPTLGDILAAALNGEHDAPIDDAPEAVVTFEYVTPLVTTHEAGMTVQGELAVYPWPILDPETGTHIGDVSMSALDWGRAMAVPYLRQELAEHLGVSVAEVHGALLRLSSNLNGLIDSPHGWSMLGKAVAALLGQPANDDFYMVTVQ